MKKQKKDILDNRAEAGEAIKNQCGVCGEELLFAMKDNYHEFSMGLTTILMCLKIAEEQGYLPVIQDKWWLSVKDRYSI